ncbi:26866_t:CDS:2, partial [Dentiscutata erythropus]
RQLRIKEMVQLLVNNNLSELEDLYLNSNEWNKMCDLLTILQPIYEATIFLSSASHPTVSDIQSGYIVNKISHQNSFEELNNYLELPLEENTDPLSWLKTYQTRYPILSRLAKNYLTIQATSIPCLGLGQTEDMI